MGETDHVEDLLPLRIGLPWGPVPEVTGEPDNGDDFYAAVEPWFGVN